ncbi:MAG: glycosyl transferase [Deltaproteobacteria bacterium]|nr:glycosyl transferase [Deltaproteobacteria bacterium]
MGITTAIMDTIPAELTISIIIPVHNAGDYFRNSLQSIADSDSPPLEIIVVADGDSDGSWRIAKEFGARILHNPESQGPARARNLGARAAVGNILLFIDADITIPRNALSQVAAVFRGDPGLAALFGSYDDEPQATDFLSQYRNLFHHYVHQTACEEASTFWSGCGAIRREVFTALSGFNEHYRQPSIEDIELGYRLRTAGYRIRLVKELKVKHLKRWGMISLLRADFFYRALPWTRLILREGRMLNDLNLKLSSRLSVICVCLLTAILPATVWQPWLAAPAAFLVTVLLALNWGLYCFFKDKRGLLFALRVIPWNWLYFLYSGLAFAIGLAEHRMNGAGCGAKSC